MSRHNSGQYTHGCLEEATCIVLVSIDVGIAEMKKAILKSKMRNDRSGRDAPVTADSHGIWAVSVTPP